MSKAQLGFLAIVTVVATRLVIGWHFYQEGTSKLRADNWTAAPVLAQAKGPFAEYFHSLTPQQYALLDLLEADPDEEAKLLDESEDVPKWRQELNKHLAEEVAEWRREAKEDYGLDLSEYTILPTVDIWWHQRERLGDYYRFEDDTVEGGLKEDRGKTRKAVIELREQRRELAAEIEKLETALLPSEDLESASPDVRRGNEVIVVQLQQLKTEFEKLDKKFREQEQLYKDQETEILTYRGQPDTSMEVIELWKVQLGKWIVENYDELNEYFGYKRRLENIESNPARQEVATLEAQASKIESDMRKAAGPLVAGISDIWDGFGKDLNRLAIVHDQAELDEFKIWRPDEPSEELALIDKFIPWFDTIIGALLILGLFTRPAAIAAAAFLLSVILMQPPWADGAAPTYYQAVEMFALLVLAAVGAGRYAGLDFFLRCLYFQVFPPKSAEMTRYESQRAVTAEPADASDRNTEPIAI